MKIVDFILTKIAPRLRQKRLLVFYDPADRFLAVAEALAAAQKALFLNASTHLLDALKCTHFAIQSGLKQAVVIYVPHAAPQTVEDKIADPFAAFAEIGTRFPASPADEYEQLCLQALPQKETAVRDLFAQCDHLKGPDFELIEPLFEDTSTKWTMLRGLSCQKSEPELLHWLLLAKDESYIKAATEIRLFASHFLGVTLTEEDAQNAQAARLKLWMAALMTEFMAVRGESAPAVFAAVPVAPTAARDLVLNVIRNIRNNRTTQGTYEKYARETASNLDIASHLASISVDRTCCTFVEEAQALKKQILVALRENKFSAIDALIGCLSTSIWVQNNDLFLSFVQSAVAFHGAIARLAEELNAASSQSRLQTIIADYCQSGALVDRLARRFVAQADELRGEDLAGLYAEDLEKVCANLLCFYRTVKEREHTRFINAINEEDWPSGLGSNASFFSTEVAPLLNQGKRVVLVIVDALRYEVALSLAESLRNFNPQLKPACAVFPTITTVGKAALLPNGEQLSIDVDLKNNTITPLIAGTAVLTVDDRMKILRGQYGDRFKHMKTKDFLSKKPSEFAKTELLCLRYDDIDETLETENSSMLDAISRGIQHLSQVIRRINVLEKFSDVLIVTDHGFGLNLKVGAGDKCNKPLGTWVATHDRFLLGDGEPDSANVVLPAEQLGIRTNARFAAFPRALCAYQAGRQYFHGGVSLAEAVVPIMKLQLSKKSVDNDAASDQLILELVPRKNRFTTLIVRLTLRVRGKALQCENEQTEHRVQIVVKEKGSKDQAGLVLDNDAGILTVIDGDIDFRVKLFSSDEQTRTIQVVALDQKTGKQLAETSFEVEVLQ